MIKQAKVGRPTLTEDRGITSEAVLNTYWAVGNIQKTAKALQISMTSARKYLIQGGINIRKMRKYRQPYPWFRKGTGVSWNWLSGHRREVAMNPDMVKLAAVSGIPFEALKRTISRRREIALAYLKAHGKPGKVSSQAKFTTIDGTVKSIQKDSIMDCVVEVDRYTLEVRLEMLYCNGYLGVSVMPYPKAIEFFQATTGTEIPIPAGSILIKTVGDFFPLQDTSTLVLPAAALREHQSGIVRR